MRKHRILRNSAGSLALLALLYPTAAWSQSRGAGPSGAGRGYFSGSASTGHHDNSGSTATGRREEAPRPTAAGAEPPLGSHSPTAEDQETARRIREALAVDQGLAPYAHGLGIDVNAGAVTLHGPVKTEKDKADIAATAQRVAGVTVVHNQLQIAPNLSGTVSGSAKSAAR